MNSISNSFNKSLNDKNKNKTLNNKNIIQTIYIPRILPNISAEYIKETIEYQDIGIVSHVDLIQRQNNKDKSNCNMAFVHLTHLCNNPMSFHIYEALNNKPNEQIKITHNACGDYWILLPFHKKNTLQVKHKSNSKNKTSIRNKLIKNENIKLKEINESLMFQVKNLKEKLSILELELIDRMHIPPPPVLKRQTARSYDNLPILANIYDDDNLQPSSPHQSLITQEDDQYILSEDDMDFEMLDEPSWYNHMVTSGTISSWQQ
jgi:hypothetical protein